MRERDIKSLIYHIHLTKSFICGNNWYGSTNNQERQDEIADNGNTIYSFVRAVVWSVYLYSETDRIQTFNLHSAVILSICSFRGVTNRYRLMKDTPRENTRSRGLDANVQLSWTITYKTLISTVEMVMGTPTLHPWCF